MRLSSKRRSRSSDSATSACRSRSRSAASCRPSGSTSASAASTSSSGATTTRSRSPTSSSPSATKLEMTADPAKLADCTFYIVAVPTPIDSNNRPDLGPMITRDASTIGPHLKKGDIVVYESTVYPGVTEEICGPILDEKSGLKNGVDYFLGYSPERINPGDKEHTFEKIMKVVSGQNAGDARARRAGLRLGRHRRRAPRAVDQGRRGREGDREHAARSQHRADERARADLRSHGHPHAGRARGRRHEVELPASSRPASSAVTASASIRTT